MTYPLLNLILKNTFRQHYTSEMVERLWNDLGQYDEIPEKLLSDESYCFMRFNYKKFRLTYVSGKVDCCGIRLLFKHDGYSHINVNPTFNYIRKEVVNYVLIVPNYKPEHWGVKKSIIQQSNLVRSDKDFIRYKNKIDEKYS
jgi:hypothetical protein